MAFTFLKAKGLEIGNSLVERTCWILPRDRRIMPSPRGVKFYLPVDCVVAASREADAETKIVPVQEIPKGGTAWILDRHPSNYSMKLSKMPRPFCGMDPWVCSKSMPSPEAPLPWPMRRRSIRPDDRRRRRDVTCRSPGRRNRRSISFISTGGGAALELLEGKIFLA